MSAPAVAQMLLHIDAHEEGGLGFTNKKLLDQQRGCARSTATGLEAGSFGQQSQGSEPHCACACVPD